MSTSSRFGQGSGLIALSNLRCNGSELMLGSCPSLTVPQSCNHSQDVGIRCQLRTGMALYGSDKILDTKTKVFGDPKAMGCSDLSTAKGMRVSK